MIAERKVDRAFLQLLAKFEREGRDVSPNRSNSFAPTLFAVHADAAGVSKEAFEAAMNRLLSLGQIKIDESGPPSRRYKKLRLSELHHAEQRYNEIMGENVND
jgi:hypothetical protein